MKKYRLAALAALLGIVLMLLPGGNAEAEPAAGSPDAEAFDRAAVQEEMENILRRLGRAQKDVQIDFDVKDRVKILGGGTLSMPLEVTAHAFSKSAVAAIEAQQGKVVKL